MSWISWTILFFLGCLAILFMLIAVGYDYPTDEVELSNYTPESLLRELNRDLNTQV